jgi:hypothetical protein
MDCTFKWIVSGRERCGRVIRNADGTFTGQIGTVEAHGQSEADAFRQVVAAVTGLDVSEISHDVLHQKKVQADTEAIIDWLKDNAARHDGRLTFTNTDLARAIGKRKPDQALGNLMSRLDFACYLCGLPSLGCAAAETFAGAWQDVMVGVGTSRSNRCARAPGRIIGAAQISIASGTETQRLQSGRAPLAWGEELAKHEARIRTWAET